MEHQKQCDGFAQLTGTASEQTRQFVSRTPTVEYEVNYVSRQIPISQACELVWTCTDVISGSVGLERIGQAPGRLGLGLGGTALDGDAPRVHEALMIAGSLEAVWSEQLAKQIPESASAILTNIETALTKA